MFDGLYQSAIIFFVPYLVYGSGATWSGSGRQTDGLYDFGTTIAVAGVIAANLYVGVNTRYWTFITALVLGGSTLLVYLWIPIYSGLASLPYNGEVAVIYPTFFFWATTLVTVFLAVGPRWIISSLRQSYFPRDKDIIREAWISGDLKSRLGVRRRRGGPAQPDVPSFVTNVDLSAQDERGAYQAAAMASPHKEGVLSPFASEPGTPRDPFSYPPPSPNIDSLFPISPTPRSQSIMPTPLLIRHSPQRSPSPLADPPANTLVTPVSGISYVSPTALDAYDLASAEIKRLHRTSTEIGKAALSGMPKENKRASTINAIRRLSRGSDERRHSASPAKTPSISSGIAMRGLLNEDRIGLSPIRASFDIGAENDETFEIHGHDRMDFTENRGWDNQTSRRGSMVGDDSGYAV